MTARWIEVNGVSLRYEVSGTGEDVLVLIHEMGGTLESFDPVIATLGTTRRILRYDTRGAGLSEKIRGVASIDDLANDLVALLDALDLDRPATVGGCAVGAAIAIRFAALHPQRVRALIAMAPAVGLPPERRAAALERSDTLERDGTRPSADARLMSSYPPTLRLDEARFRDVRCRRLGMDPVGVAALTRMLAGLDLSENLAAIACPTLVLAGRHDGDRPPEVVAKVAKAIPGAEYRIIETGHFMALQTPELLISELERFLQSLPTQGAVNNATPSEQLELPKTSHRFMFFSNPLEGQEDAYLDWYTGQHIHDLLKIPGFVAAQFHRLSDAQLTTEQPHRYMMIWELETGDPSKVFALVRQGLATGSTVRSDAIDRTTGTSRTFTPITRRVTAREIASLDAEQIRALSRLPAT